MIKIKTSIKRLGVWVILALIFSGLHDYTYKTCKEKVIAKNIKIINSNDVK